MTTTKFPLKTSLPTIPTITFLYAEKDFEFDPVNGTNIIAREVGYKQTIFYNSTLTGKP
jgi:hypothetical protein